MSHYNYSNYWTQETDSRRESNNLKMNMKFLRIYFGEEEEADIIKQILQRIKQEDQTTFNWLKSVYWKRQKLWEKLLR